MKQNLTQIFSLLLALMLCMSLAACGEQNDSAPRTPEPAPVDAPDDSAAAEDDLTRGTGLVVDFEEAEEPDENPDRAITRAPGPILQNVITRLDGTGLRGDAYFYRALLPEAYQPAYDVIRAGLVEGSVSIDMPVAIPKADFKTVYRAVYYDSPDLFWVDGGFSYSYNKYDQVTKVKPKYNELASDIAGNRAKMEQAVSGALADMWSLSDPTAQVKYAHDYLVSTITYDLNSTYNQTAYSALVNGKSVCAGYSRAFQYMMQKMGIRCGYIVGTCSGAASGAHAWNIVELDGEFYAMDVTWDDPIGAKEGKFYYDYFNITDQKLSADHARTEPSSSLPTASGTSKSFASAFGGSQFGTDFNAINGTLPEGYGTSTTFLGDSGSTGSADVSGNPYLS